MSYTVGRVKLEVFNAIREYSNAGTIDTGDNIQDYNLSIIPMINLFQKTIARDSKKISKVYDIAHKMPNSQLGSSWYENQVHSGDGDTATQNDVTYESTGSRAYSLSVSDIATIYIEEETATDVWTVLETINHVSAAGEGYETYKGLTNVSDATNNVRIRFSGLYRYMYQWFALYADNFVDDDAVPAYGPYVPYDMLPDFYLRDRVDWKHEYQQYDGFSDYKYTETEITTKTVLIPWNDSGEFKVHYYAYPTEIANVTTSDPDAQDAVVIDLPEEACTALVLLIASSLKRDEDPYMASTLQSEAYIELNNLEYQDTTPQQQTSVVNVSNW